MNRTPREVAESYWKAECEHDVEKVLAHYHHDAVMQPPGQVLRGHDEIRTFYESSFAQYSGLEVKIVHEVSADNEAALEWEAVLIDHQGVRHPLNGVNVIRVEEGKYRYVRAYFDPTVFAK